MALSKKAAFDLVGLKVRAEPGDAVRLPTQVRPGDFLGTAGSTKYKVLRTELDRIVLQEVDRNGRPKTLREKKFAPTSLRELQMKRIQELGRPDVSFDTAAGYVDARHGFPPASVSTQEKYRAWLQDCLTKPHGSPFCTLGKDELRHQEQLKRHLDRLLRERGVDDNWSWTAPPPVQVGARIQDPSQVQLGDFVEYYETVYRIVKLEDDLVHAVPISSAGRPTGRARTFNRQFLKNYRVRRVAPLLRDDVAFQDAEAFADRHLGEPPSSVTNRSEYREWLTHQFKNLVGSPYYGLGADEVEHQHALAKQVSRLLENRGVTPGWDRA